MSEVILSDYFYGDESEQFIYFRIPRLLITSPRFKHLSTDAKLLYGMLLDRMGLSARNNWYDADGRIYIYYTVEEICGDMNCGRDKAMKLLSELDTGKGVGLIERIKQGQGILHDFFRPGEEQYFTFDQTVAIRRGLDFRDLICPDGLAFKAGHFEMGDKVGRVLFLKDYASYIKDEMIADLSDFPRNLMLSIDILPIPTDEAVREIQNRILGIETDITRWQQRQNDKNNFTASIPYELEQLRGETKEFLSDLTERDQRMIFAVVTLVHVADSLEQLDADTEALLSIGREHLCQFSTLRYQQEDGLRSEERRVGKECRSRWSPYH